MAPRPMVLVVEDDAALRKVLELRLKIEGFDVSVAQDGQEGLDQLERVHPAVVICDLMMPRVDGFGFCRSVRGRPGFDDLPIVLLTAHQRDQEIDALLEVGGIAFMNKPFDAPTLVTTLRGMIAPAQADAS